MRAKKANSILFALPTIKLMIEYSKTNREKLIIRESAFDKKKKKPGLKFNPGLVLISIQTTGPKRFGLSPN